MTIKDRYEKVLETFAATIPEPQTELHYDNPYQLLLAVILSTGFRRFRTWPRLRPMMCIPLFGR